MDFKYDSQADVLSVEVSRKPIDYAQEMGNLIVHFTKDSQPVLLEVLQAKSFLQNSFKIFPKKIQKSILCRVIS